MNTTATAPLETASAWQRLAGVAVHLFTAIGALLAFAMVHFAYAGQVQLVLWLFLAAMVIDGTDGFMARRLRVAQVLPRFDGALLDNVVDFLTYAFAPMVLLWSAGYLPGGAAGWAVVAVVLLASCYQFCRTDAKTPDHYFRGFPSYWNVVAFYVVVLDLGTAVTAAILVALSVAAFIPICYLYPSRTQVLWRVTMVATAIWLGLYALIVATYPDPSGWAVLASVVYLGYYAGVSVVLTVLRRR
ncbi:CDP-alcohol phosphatidyltransferase family protein [Pseudactinotalea sp. Z1748]|uniref:CDP-alcohol phosphatidyltransferase family protein n=1 Tax=Pseudactinotalea sp. Z1748 TaxID=3413027 RepID=UPI003C79A86B